jgi:hypothetical protein
MKPRDLVGPLLTATVAIVLAVVGATWKLSTQIGDLRVEIEAQRGEDARLNDKVSTLWAEYVAIRTKGPQWTYKR